MNLQAIYVANITSFLLIFFLLFSRFITRVESTSADKVFGTMIGLALIACIIEPITFSVDGVPGVVSYWVNLLGNTYLYFANGMGAFFWIIYVDLCLFHDMSRIRRIYYKIAIPFGILVLSLFGNIFFKYYFYVDDHNIYHRQPTIYIFYIYIMLCAIYSIVLYCVARYKLGRIAFFPIFMYLIPIIVGSALQMVFYGISLAWLGTAIGMVALYMSLQHQKAYTDSLTGLYNRMYLEHMMYVINNDASTDFYGIMMDMNYFKEINDTYGHSVGDRALRDLADILLGILDKKSFAFRYAGDEFIILIKTSDEEDVLEFENLIHSAIEEFNESKRRPYKLSVSLGHAKYDHDLDNEDKFLRKIDEAMYSDKKRVHSKS